MSKRTRVVPGYVGLSEEILRSSNSSLDKNDEFYYYRNLPRMLFLQPLADLKKYFAGFAKSYKKNADALKVVGKPFAGLLHIGQGLLIATISAIFTPMILTFAILSLVVAPPFLSLVYWAKNKQAECSLSRYMWKYFLSLPVTAAAFSLGVLAEGISRMIHGALQIATTPLSCVRAMVRGIITKKKGHQKIEDYSKVDALLEWDDESEQRRENINRKLRIICRREPEKSQKMGLTLLGPGYDLDKHYFTFFNTRTKILDFVPLDYMSIFLLKHFLALPALEKNIIMRQLREIRDNPERTIEEKKEATAKILADHNLLDHPKLTMMLQKKVGVAHSLNKDIARKIAVMTSWEPHARRALT